MRSHHAFRWFAVAVLSLLVSGCFVSVDAGDQIKAADEARARLGTDRYRVTITPSLHIDGEPGPTVVPGLAVVEVDL